MRIETGNQNPRRGNSEPADKLRVENPDGPFETFSGQSARHVFQGEMCRRKRDAQAPPASIMNHLSGASTLGEILV